MATTVSQHQVSAISDPASGAQILSSVVRGNDQTLRTGINDHDADTGIHLQSSSLASRPAAGTSGRKWITSDGLRIYLDNGSSWDEAQYLPLAAGGTVAAPTIVQSTTANQLQVGYDGSNHLRVDVSSAGAVTLNATGASAGFTFSDALSVTASVVIAAGSAQALVATSTNTDQLQLLYDGSNYFTVSVSNAGAVTYNATGASAGHTFSDAVTCSSTLTSTGNFTVGSSTFTVTAASGNTVVGGTLGVTGNFAVNTNKFTVAASSGNTVVAGTLSVGGIVITPGAAVLSMPANTTFVFNGALSGNAGAIRLPHGSAPGTPVDGDMWTTTAGLYVRINGSTVGPLS